MLRLKRLLCGLLISAALATEVPAMAQRQEVFPDPGWRRPRIGFQQHEDATPAREPNSRLADIPGEPNGWRIVQWNRDMHLQPEQMQRDPPDLSEPGLGAASWSFSSPNGSARVAIYRHGDGYAFDLRQRNGILTAAGGSNLFISAPVALVDVRFDQSLVYDIAARVSEAVIATDSAAAISRGIVMAQIFTGFVIQSVAHDGGENVTAFMQIPIAQSRPSPVAYRHCKVRPNGKVLIYNSLLPSDPMLAFKTDNGPLHPLHYDLNRHLCDLLSQSFPCEQVSGVPGYTLPASAQDPRNWRLTSMYLGLETQNRDGRSASLTGPSAGTASAGILIAALHVRRGPSQSAAGHCPRADRQ
jgi:hypothetical protein